MGALQSVFKDLPVIFVGVFALTAVKAVIEPSEGVAYAMFLTTVAIVVSIVHFRDLARRQR